MKAFLGILVLVLLAGCGTTHYITTRTVVHVPGLRVTVTVTPKPVTVTRTVTVPSGIPAACTQELWQDWANRAPVAANMDNVAGQYAPAGLPYMGQIMNGG